MIGDRRHDILGAAGNGIDSIGVLWGYGDRPELTDCRATHIVRNIEELSALLLNSSTE